MKIWCMTISLAAVGALAGFAWSEDKPDLAKGMAKATELQKKLLAKFDLNQDGEVDEEERAKASELMKKELAAGKIPDELKPLLDADRDGKISPREFAAAQEMAARLRGRGGPPQFGAGGGGTGGTGGFGGAFDGPSGFGGQIPPDVKKKFDKNKDGELDEKEQKAAMAALGPKKSRAQQLKEKLDLNGDGKITKEERETVAAEKKAEQEEKKAEQAAKKGKSKKKDD